MGKMMRWLWVSVAAVLLSAGAQAQVPSSQVSPGTESAMLAYRQLGLGLDAMIKDKEAALSQLRERLAQIDAYLKACGDRPGCTVPATEEAAK